MTPLIVVLVVLYVLAGVCVGDLVTRAWGPGAWSRFAAAAAVWPLLAVAGIVGLVRELATRGDEW